MTDYLRGNEPSPNTELAGTFISDCLVFRVMKSSILFLIFKFRFIHLILCVSVLLHVSLVLVEVRNDHQIPWELNYR